MLKAGFAEQNITPEQLPIRTYMKTADSVMDPLFAHAAVLCDGRITLAFLSLDVVIVEATYVAAIKKAIAERCGIPASHVMVCATHNHACPAVVHRPGMEKEEAYIEWMIARGSEAVCDAFENAAPAEAGVASGFEARVSFNRRYIKRDGSVVSQPHITPLSDDILCRESEIDPELGVVCVRDQNGTVLGMLINFACHACHHLGALSAGYPGVLAEQLKRLYGPQCTTVFLNGPCGNVHHRDFSNPDAVDTKEKVGGTLAEDVQQIIGKMSFQQKIPLQAVDSSIPIPYRSIEGLRKNIDRMEDFNVLSGVLQKNWYAYSLELLTRLHEESDHEMATLQAFRLGETVFVSVPAEYFAEYALRIKSASSRRHTYIVSLANGWLGYIPTKEAFSRRGGHETTWLFGSKMAHDAGDRLAAEAIRLLGALT